MKILYTEDAVYINKREIFSDRSAISKEYDIYIDLGCAVRVNALHRIVPQWDTTVDVGKYRADGTSGGKYVQV